MEPNTILADIPKNVLETVRVTLTEYKGVKYADLRVWYRPDPAGKDELKPSRKGITIRPELLPPIIAALQRVVESEGIEVGAAGAEDRE